MDKQHEMLRVASRERLLVASHRRCLVVGGGVHICAELGIREVEHGALEIWGGKLGRR